jgi:hypothetical protein
MKIGLYDWSSHHILFDGCRWCIGDGKKVKVTSDPCLRSAGSSWVDSLQKNEVYDMAVAT